MHFELLKKHLRETRRARGGRVVPRLLRTDADQFADEWGDAHDVATDPMWRAGGVPIHPQNGQFDRSLDEKGVRGASADPDRLCRGKYPASGRGGDMYDALLRIHKLVPGVSVLRLLASGRPMTAGADDRRRRLIRNQHILVG